MILARVLGNVVATAHHPSYDGHKLMVYQPVDESGADCGPSQLAIDTVQAGPGDLVLVMREGNGVRQILAPQQPPIRSLIVGIVDQVDVDLADAQLPPTGTR
ncbi:MAG: EutN/CcmL family microcompartment protein [Myxococcota bacterium]|jgi:ethanolamine utilization protein EutN|nr:EutN/CcmL family microcompartment protein [Myxococcota bacterium]